MESKTLPVRDGQVYLDFLSVLKHSSMFWDPIGENGISLLSNNGGGVVDENGHGIQAKAINWWKVAGCDAVGMFGGALSAGICSACAYIGEH
jgi:hypothetical protein